MVTRTRRIARIANGTIRPKEYVSTNQGGIQRKWGSMRVAIIGKAGEVDG